MAESARQECAKEREERREKRERPAKREEERESALLGKERGHRHARGVKEKGRNVKQGKGN